MMPNSQNWQRKMFGIMRANRYQEDNCKVRFGSLPAAGFKTTGACLVSALTLFLGACAGTPPGGDEPLTDRLKYRDGPVCMCAKGQSEKEIQEGQKRQLEAVD
jgi:hypothetical protein